MVWIPDGEKEFDIFSGFDIILASVTQTDRRTSCDILQ